MLLYNALLLATSVRRGRWLGGGRERPELRDCQVGGGLVDRCDGGARAGVRLLLIRCAHGETHAAGVAEGEETERGLSATGRSQAARLAERLAAEQSSLQVSRVYSTGIRRAAQTATIVAQLLGLSVVTTPLGPAHGKPVERAMSGGEGGQLWGQWAP
ncbi:histidine phosphatase family protein, partial [Nocardia abscessus]|uniref:histidine phosphatase family protein n=1 Tax=Nocardia abscessus TaxID=120957 RepID=UPI002455F6B4